MNELKLHILCSGLPRIFSTPLALLKDQLQLNAFEYIDLTGVFWQDSNPEKNYSAITTAFNLITNNQNIFLEPARDFSNIAISRTKPSVPPQNTLSMHFARKLLLSKIDHSNNYTDKDIFIYLRPDICLTGPIDWNTITSQISENTILVPKNGNFFNGINDQFAICNFSVIQIYLSVYDQIQDYYNNEKVVFHPEILLKHHLQKNKINPVPLDHFNLIFKDNTRIHLNTILKGDDLLQ